MPGLSRRRSANCAARSYSPSTRCATPDRPRVFASDRPTEGFDESVLSAAARATYERFLRAWEQATGGPPTEEALAGFTAAWALFHDVLPHAGTLSATSIAAAARTLDLPKRRPAQRRRPPVRHRLSSESLAPGAKLPAAAHDVAALLATLLDVEQFVAGEPAPGGQVVPYRGLQAQDLESLTDLDAAHRALDGDQQATAAVEVTAVTDGGSLRPWHPVSRSASARRTPSAQ